MTNPGDLAFPYHPNLQTGGLTKREYFAAMAMQGDLSEGSGVLVEGAASFWLRCADALIAELNKEPQQ